MKTPRVLDQSESAVAKLVRAAERVVEETAPRDAIDPPLLDAIYFLAEAVRGVAARPETTAQRSAKAEEDFSVHPHGCFDHDDPAEPGRAPKEEAVRALEDYAAGTETQIGAISRIAAAIDSMRARTGLVTALVNAHRVAVAGEQAIVEGVVMRREDHPAEKRSETAEASPEREKTAWRWGWRAGVEAAARVAEWWDLEATAKIRALPTDEKSTGEVKP